MEKKTGFFSIKEISKKEKDLVQTKFFAIAQDN